MRGLIGGNTQALEMATTYKTMPLAVVLERMSSFMHQTVRDQAHQLDAPVGNLSRMIEFYDELLHLHKAVSGSGNPNVPLTMDYLFTRLKEVLGQ